MRTQKKYLQESNMRLTVIRKPHNRLRGQAGRHPRPAYIRSRYQWTTCNPKIVTSFTPRSTKTQGRYVNRSMSRTCPGGTCCMRSTCTWRKRRIRRSRSTCVNKTSFSGNSALSNLPFHRQAGSTCNRITIPNKKSTRGNWHGSTKDSQVSFLAFVFILSNRGTRP